MEYGSRNLFLLVVFALFCAAVISPVHAEILSSTNFQLFDPLINAGGGRSTSTSFDLLQIWSQLAPGTSSASSFQVQGGFLAFPSVTLPVVTPTAGDAQVSLSWTASQGFVGWSVGGYSVGQSTVSGGPYTYTSVGNVTSSTRTGLTNGTTYYFVVLPQDAFGNRIGTSTQVSSTPVAAPPPPPPPPAPSGGGGGGGGILTVVTAVQFSGVAYQNAEITILKDGAVFAQFKTGISASFTYRQSDINPGIYSFSVSAEDKNGNKSLPLSFTVNIQKDITTTIGNIIIPPTFEPDKTQVDRGQPVVFSGYSAPQARVDIEVNSEELIVLSATSSTEGEYKQTLDTARLEEGVHTGRAKTILLDGSASTFSRLKQFLIGKGVLKPSECLGADINGDGRVNLTDFSILLFYWNIKLPANPCADINQDGVVNLRDFSIMLFYWSG